MSLINESVPDIVFIAGGTQGIGNGIALHLAKVGMKKVIFCGRDENYGRQVADLLESSGAKGYYIKADLTQIEDCEKIAVFCENYFGQVDGLVYAAGVCDRGTIETTTESIWDKLFNTNVKGAFFLVQKMLPLLRQGLGKSIVTICSFSSYCGRPELIAYNSSKAALVTLTKSLANTLKDECIRVNGINLGWTDTTNERNIQKSLGHPENWLDEMGEKQPFGRLLQPQDVAYLVEFLLTKKSAMMTGSIIDFNQHVRI